MKKHKVQSRMCYSCSKVFWANAKGIRNHAEKVCKQPSRSVRGNSVHPKATKVKR